MKGLIVTILIENFVILCAVVVGGILAYKYIKARGAFEKDCLDTMSNHAKGIKKIVSTVKDVAVRVTETEKRIEEVKAETAKAVADIDLKVGAVDYAVSERLERVKSEIERHGRKIEKLSR